MYVHHFSSVEFYRFFSLSEMIFYDTVSGAYVKRKLVESPGNGKTAIWYEICPNRVVRFVGFLSFLTESGVRKAANKTVNIS